MIWHLELWVEGPTDASTHARWKDAEEGLKPAEPARGALVPLVRKALATSPRLPPDALDRLLPEAEISAHRLARKLRAVVAFNDDRRRSPISIHARKVMSAIARTRTSSPETLVLAVWDRDGKEEAERDRDEIHKIFQERGRLGAAVAICVEELEAWLLGDPAVFRLCFKRGPKRGLPGQPEALPHPKEKLVEILNDLGVEREDWAAIYRDMAEKIDIESLERSCPRGFGQMRRALRELIEPCLSSTVPT